MVNRIGTHVYMMLKQSMGTFNITVISDRWKLLWIWLWTIRDSVAVTVQTGIFSLRKPHRDPIVTY